MAQNAKRRSMLTLQPEMWDTLRLWLPRILGPARHLQASAVELTLPGSCGRGRPSLDLVMR
eukprot:497451-Amphidinium_carterae.1